MKKLSKMILIIGIPVGIVFLILGSIFGATLTQKTLLDESNLGITDESSVTIQQAYAYEFELELDQKAYIEFGAKYENSSVTLKIIGKGAYDSYYSTNTTIPAAITGIVFFMDQPNINVNPDTISTAGATSVSATYDGYFSLEFMGDGTTSGTDAIWSRPGSYVVLVYGSNVGGVNFTDAHFDLKVSVEGPGQELKDVFTILGWIIIIVAFAALIAIKFLPVEEFVQNRSKKSDQTKTVEKVEKPPKAQKAKKTKKAKNIPNTDEPMEENQNE